MTENKTIVDEEFQKLLKEKLGSQYERAFLIFTNHGHFSQFDIANQLLQAADDQQIELILTQLENNIKSNTTVRQIEGVLVVS